MGQMVIAEAANQTHGKTSILPLNYTQLNENILRLSLDWVKSKFGEDFEVRLTLKINK
jgi:hypothetical protein